MQMKVTRYGPVALSATYTTNVLNPPTTTGGVNAGSASHYIILKHVRIVNKGAAAATFRFWLGATGGNVAGTEVIGYDVSVAVGGTWDWYGAPGLRLDAADFLVGGASAGSTLTFQAEGEQGIV